MNNNISEQCSLATKKFIDKLADTYIQKFSEEKENLQKITNSIEKWLTTGESDEYINKLFLVVQPTSDNSQSSLDIKRNFPIWWSGFFVEDPNPETNPIQNMKSAAAKINGFTSLDTIMGLAINEQNIFWKTCSKLSDFNWGQYISEIYTEIMLISKPKNIGLFLNKKSEDFVNTNFFKFEIKIINDKYKDSNVNMHIFNLSKNCIQIIDLLSIAYKNINFICYEDNCKTLSECVINYNPILNGGNINYNNSNAKNKIHKNRRYKNRHKTKSGKTNQSRHKSRSQSRHKNRKTKISY